MATFDCAELAEKLIRSGVPCGAVRSIDEVVADPHTQHREMIVDIGAYRGTGSPIKLSRTPVSYHSAPPRYAQHTAEVMAERGLDIDSYREVLPWLDGQDAAKTNETV